MFLLPFFLKSVGNLMFQYIVWNRYTMKFLHILSPDFIQIWEENSRFLGPGIFRELEIRELKV